MLLKTKPIKSKKAVSVIIGYVLLIVFAIILGGITYTWIKTYIPSQQNLECSEGVSIFVKKSVFNDSTPEFPERLLKITIKNTGRFSVAGYFIHATNESDQKLATIDLSGYLDDTFGGVIVGNSVLFILGDNNLKSGEEKNHVFDIPSELGTLFNVRITPVRYQEIENRNRFVSCVNSRTEQVIGEDIEVGGETGGECSPECSGSTLYCVSSSCVECIGNSDCTGTDTCINGACVVEGCIDEDISVACALYECGIQTNNCGTEVDCDAEVGGCAAGFECNSGGQCTSLCGNGVIDTGEGETCDDGNLVSGDGCSSTCAIETDDGWTCSGEPSVCQLCGNGIEEGTEQCDDGNTIDNDQCKNDCTLSPTTDCSSNCISQEGSSWGYCTSNAECSDQGGTNPFSGNQYCGAGEGKCCCIP